MAKPKLRRYWDTCGFLAIINAEAGRVEICKDILKEAEGGNIQIVTSALTIIEAVKPKGSPTPLPDDKGRLIIEFFENDYILIVNLDRFLAVEARKLCWQHNIHPRDVIHLATALSASVECFETYDNKLIEWSGRLGDPVLEIRIPTWRGQLDIPGTKEQPR